MRWSIGAPPPEVSDGGESAFDFAPRAGFVFFGAMKLPTARFVIARTMERMAGLYGQPVFDEWALLVPGAGMGGVPAYEGPRADEFRAQLPKDAQPILARLAGQKLALGGFEFAAQGEGTHLDAIMQVGEGAFLVCNNTRKSMADIRADARWLKAQTAFVELSELFRVDPLLG